MESLEFWSAHALVHWPRATAALQVVLPDVYPLLFKMSFLEEKVDWLYEVTRTWPLPVLSLTNLLAGSSPCASCLYAFFAGLRDHVGRSGTSTDDGAKSTTSALWGSCPLHTVDLMGVQDGQKATCLCGKTLGRWGRTQALAQACVEATMIQQRTSSPGSIQVIINAFVTKQNCNNVLTALRAGPNAPITISCTELRVDNLELEQVLELVQLIGPLERLDMVHNVRLGFNGLPALLPHCHLHTLRALSLPPRAVDVLKMGPDLEKTSLALAALSSLAELNMPYSRLTGHVQQLFGGMVCSLSTLDFSGCGLSSADLRWLAQAPIFTGLQKLDFSSHPLGQLSPTAVYRMIRRTGPLLESLRLEDCDLGDGEMTLLLASLRGHTQLKHFSLTGNIFSSNGLKCLVSWMASHLPALQRLEYHIPPDCFPSQVENPLNPNSTSPQQATTGQPDGVRVALLHSQLNNIVAQAGRSDLHLEAGLQGGGEIDFDMKETWGELRSALLQSLSDSIKSYLDSLTDY
uniref:leucine-rich repeat-containing protein 14B-like isoform X1 n=2 Tax=Myxine glutinosa TaxID=7769 RepID=UPI0035902618